MAVALNQLGQVSLSVDDVDPAEEFYGRELGIGKLYRFGDLVFFDCAGVRLFLEKSRSQAFVPNGPVLYSAAKNFTAETPSSQSSECSLHQELFTLRPPRLSGEISEAYEPECQPFA